MNKVICDKCGSEMQPINPNVRCGMICPKCGWGWATSPYDPMSVDENTYVITLLAGNNASEENIKTIAHIIEQNYLSAKRTIEQAPAPLCSGKAKQVKRIVKVLTENAIHFEVEPDYPYDVSQD